MHRRQLVVGLTTVIPFLAGCATLLDRDSDDDSSDSSTTTSSPEPVPSTTTGTTVGEIPQTTHAQTTRSTSTAIPIPTVTSTLTPPSTPSLTAGQTPGTGTALMDPSTFETYTSDTYPFSLKYPGSWRVDPIPTDPDRAVMFTAPSGDVGMQVNITQNPGSESLNQNVRQGIKGFKRSVRQDDGTVNDLGRRNVTLANGNPAAILNILATTPSGVKARSMILLTQNNGIVYMVAIFVLERMYSSTVEQGMNTILTSFTISS